MITLGGWRPMPKPEKRTKVVNGVKYRKARRVSKARAQDNAVYSKIKKAYLDANPKCLCCGGIATDIHHMRGRMGELLYNIKYFLAVCRSCHDRIEHEPVWAKRMGYSVDRLTIEN